jgi:hypothetical protein
MSWTWRLRKSSRYVVFQASVLEIAVEFGTEFLQGIAYDLLTELSMGAAAGLAAPGLGGFVGAGLDYVNASQMPVIRQYPSAAESEAKCIREKVSLKIGLCLCPRHRPVRLPLSSRQSADASPRSPAPQLLGT